MYWNNAGMYSFGVRFSRSGLTARTQHRPGNLPKAPNGARLESAGTGERLHRFARRYTNFVLDARWNISAAALAVAAEQVLALDAKPVRQLSKYIRVERQVLITHHRNLTRELL